MVGAGDQPDNNLNNSGGNEEEDSGKKPKGKPKSKKADSGATVEAPSELKLKKEKSKVIKNAEPSTIDASSELKKEKSYVIKKAEPSEFPIDAPSELKLKKGKSKVIKNAEPSTIDASSELKKEKSKVIKKAEPSEFPIDAPSELKLKKEKSKVIKKAEPSEFPIDASSDLKKEKSKVIKKAEGSEDSVASKKTSPEKESSKKKKASSKKKDVGGINYSEASIIESDISIESVANKKKKKGKGKREDNLKEESEECLASFVFQEDILRSTKPGLSTGYSPISPRPVTPQKRHSPQPCTMEALDAQSAENLLGFSPKETKKSGFPGASKRVKSPIMQMEPMTHTMDMISPGASFRVSKEPEQKGIVKHVPLSHPREHKKEYAYDIPQLPYEYEPEKPEPKQGKKKVT